MSRTPTVAVDLRPLDEADLDRVHALEVAASEDPWSRELLAGELVGDRRDRLWLVATAPDGTILGFGGVLQVVDEAHVMNLVVDPAWRRHGIARRLLGRLLLDIGDRGAIAATLEVRAGNDAAIGLYRSFGFEQAGRRPRYYPDGTDAEIMWCHQLHRPDRRELFAAMASDAKQDETQNVTTDGGRR